MQKNGTPRDPVIEERRSWSSKMQKSDPIAQGQHRHGPQPTFHGLPIRIFPLYIVQNKKSTHIFPTCICFANNNPGRKNVDGVNEYKR